VINLHYLTLRFKEHILGQCSYHIEEEIPGESVHVVVSWVGFFLRTIYTNTLLELKAIGEKYIRGLILNGNFWDSRAHNF